MTLLAAAGAALGYAVQIAGGTYAPEALAWLSVALAACVAGLILPHAPAVEHFARRWFLPLAAAAVTFQLTLLYITHPGVYMRVTTLGDLQPYFILLTIAAVLAASALNERPAFVALRLPLLLAVYALIGVWLIRNSPQPGIDTWFIHQEACETLMRGVNPYAIKLKDIYGSQSPYFAPGVSVGGFLQHGYPYPPLSLLLAFPGYALFGDHRYSNLLCATLSGAFIAYARPGPRAALAAVLFLLTPRGFQVIEDSWTEPYALMLFTATVFCACRAPRWMPIPLGLFFAVKQYTPILFPASLLLLGPGPFDLKAAARMYALAAAAALVVTLPFFLWDPRAFVWSAIRIPMMGPYRPDSLGFLPMFTKTGPVSPVPSLVFLLAACALIWWRVPRTPAGFAGAAAVTALGFFALSKQAFLNYYFFVIGALFCAAAAARIGHAPAEDLAGHEVELAAGRSA